MRISTSMFHANGLSSIQKHQSDLLDIQLKMTTFKRINNPSDDPVGMAQVNSLNRTINTIDQYAYNGDFAKSKLSLAETAISDSIEGLQRARVLGLQMSNGTYNDENRIATAQEIGQIIDQLKNMMNLNDSNGSKLFAGNSVDAEFAFVEDQNNPGYYAYIGSTNADDGTVLETNPYDVQANYGSRFVQIGFDSGNKLEPNDEGNPSRVRVSDNGDKVFGIPTGTTVFTGGVHGGTAFTDQPDQNILNVLVEFKKFLENGEDPSANVVDDITASIQQLSFVRTEIGGRQNRIEAQYDAGESFKVALMESRKNIEDMDLVKGATQLTQTENALQMAQQVFVRVQEMSLFNYLR